MSHSMQVERIQIIARQMIQKNDKTVFIVAHPDSRSTVQDITVLFGKYMIDNIDTESPVLTAAFNTLKNTNSESLFVFMKRNKRDVLGILRSNRVLYNQKELELFKQVGDDSTYNYPLFTFLENNIHFEAKMEELCRTRAITGPCFGVFCYR